MSLAEADGSGVVPLERWDLQEQAQTLGTAPARWAADVLGLGKPDAAACGRL